jgi:protein TonB
MQAALPYGIHDTRGQNRTLVSAIVGSFAIHALLLFGLVFIQAPAKHPITPAPIVARLAPAQSSPAAPRVEETPPVRREPPPPPPPQAARPRPSAQPAPLATAAPSPTAPPAPAEVARAGEPAPAAPPSAAPATPAPSGPIAKIDPQPGAAPSADSPDPATLSQYRLALMGAARKYKRYPRAALDNNWEGRADVRMIVGANGMIASLAVRTSAGYEILDKEALEMIRKAKPLTQIPASLKGREFTIDIPIIFSIKDDAQG